MTTESFVFYTSWLEAIEALEPEDQLQAFKAIARYQAYHKEPEVQGAPRAVFLMAKPVADKLYASRLAHKECGKLGGRPTKAAQSERTEDKADGNQTIPNENQKKPNDNQMKPKHNLDDNDNDNGNENDNGNRVRRFAKPTLNDVIEYCRSRNNNVDPERWYAYYESNGWRVGKNPMKDWQACIRTWERSETPKPQKKMPVYDTSLNADISAEEEQELLRLMGKA